VSIAKIAASRNSARLIELVKILAQTRDLPSIAHGVFIYPTSSSLLNFQAEKDAYQQADFNLSARRQ
jgi:hypothetical protein